MTSIVLVHGGFVDGSGWEAVYQILRKSGHPVTVVQNPTTSLADDVAVTKRALDQQPDQAVLVGHSYGGAVITEAGNHPNMAALVYIAAFAPDRGESVNTLIADPPPGAATKSPAADSNPPPELSAVSPQSAFYVQVAAVSKQEDAGALVDALKKKQYVAFASNSPGDKLFHVHSVAVCGFRSHEVSICRERKRVNGVLTPRCRTVTNYPGSGGVMEVERN